MSYSRFEEVMATKYPTYQWEAIKTTTSDEYILTIFHVWNEEKKNELGPKGPVFFQHGRGGDGTSFLDTGGLTAWSAGPAPMIQIADLGHDVYLGSNRGTEYSNGHNSIATPADDPEAYWDYDLDGLALDVLANTRAMTENAGNGKGWYIGYSQGTIQAIVALSKYESELENYLERAILLAPCFGVSGDELAKRLYADYFVNEMKKLDIYATNSSTWEADVVKICAESTEDLCEYATSIKPSQ